MGTYLIIKLQVMYENIFSIVDIVSLISISYSDIKK